MKFHLIRFKLQQFLESMKEMKEFHLYAKLNRNLILSNFESKYWQNHHWIFAIHDQYFYTLPFYFDSLYRFYEDFQKVKSTNPEILIDNHRIWENVKFIEFERSLDDFDRNFSKQLKIQMPKLNIIKFDHYLNTPSLRLTDEQDTIDLSLDNVTTLQFTRGFIGDRQNWIVSLFPNLRHLILSSAYLLSTANVLAEIFNQPIEQLDIDTDEKFQLLANRYYIYFSNVKYINFCLNYIEKSIEWYANIAIQILKNFQNLDALFMYINRNIGSSPAYETRLNQMIEYLNMNTNLDNYQIKHFRQCVLFLKQEII